MPRSEVEAKLDTLLSKFKVELSAPDWDVEEVLFSRAQDKIVSLAKRAKAIVSAIGSQQAPSPSETEEEDLVFQDKTETCLRFTLLFPYFLEHRRPSVCV